MTPDGRPRPVPCCYALLDGAAGPAAFVPLDDKPKRFADVRRLARVRDIAADPRVSLLVDRWSEDWDRLAWLRLDGAATLVEPSDDRAAHAAALAALRTRYPQYVGHGLEDRPLIRVEIQRVAGWRADGGPRP